MVLNSYEEGERDTLKYLEQQKREAVIDALKMRIIEFSSDRMRLKNGGITLFQTYSET